MRKPTDRRIERTRKLLHEALMSLVREKDYDAIVVKEILDRANIGRSTFYMHFRDKDDLLVSGIYDLLQPVPFVPALSMSRHERLVWFSLPIFEHHEQHQRGGRTKIGPRGRAVLHERLRQVLAGLITDRLRQETPRRSAIPPALLAQYLASTFVLVLNWWVENKLPLSPRKVDALFRSLVSPALQG